MASAKKPSGVEVQKEGSRRLRGDVAEALAAPEARGGISETAHTLVKFHGFYEQYDRDTATVRKQRGEDKEWQFMVRVRPTGGAMTADQYLVLDDLADPPSIVETPAQTGADAPMCMTCGVQMIRAGSCHACPTCGSTSGCSAPSTPTPASSTGT